MSRIAAIGERARVEWLILGGVAVSVADDDAAAREAWSALDHDVAVLIVTPRVATVLDAVRDQRADIVWAVLPG